MLRILVVLVVVVGIGVLAKIYPSSGPPSVVPGTSLTGFEKSMQNKLSAAEPGGWGVTGVATVLCDLPQQWIVGTSFDCEAYDPNNNDLGQLTVEIRRSVSGDEWNVETMWDPSQ